MHRTTRPKQIVSRIKLGDTSQPEKFYKVGRMPFLRNKTCVAKNQQGFGL